MEGPNVRNKKCGRPGVHRRWGYAVAVDEEGGGDQAGRSLFSGSEAEEGPGTGAEHARIVAEVLDTCYHR